jgi:hypothetical protein
MFVGQLETSITVGCFRNDVNVGSFQQRFEAGPDNLVIINN